VAGKVTAGLAESNDSLPRVDDLSHLRADLEMDMGWVNPWVGLGWVGSS